MIEKFSDNVALIHRKLTLSYLAAFLIIALLTMVMSFFIITANADNQKSAEIINIAGRQRMLSQKTGWLAMEYTMATPQDRPAIRLKLTQATTLMMDSHQYLRGDINYGVGGDAMSTTIQDYYQGQHR